MSRVRADTDPLSLPAADDAAPVDLDVLYRRNAAWLRGAILARFGPHLAPSVDDLVQETYIRAARLQGAGPIRSPRALLGQIARRLAIDQVRRQSVRTDAARVLLERTSAETGAEQHEAVLLKQIILSMPDRYRAVFLLARFEGLSHAQIAARLDLSPKAVDQYIAQACLRLGARRRTSAVARALRLGLIAPSS